MNKKHYWCVVIPFAGDDLGTAEEIAKDAAKRIHAATKYKGIAKEVELTAEEIR